MTASKTMTPKDLAEKLGTDARTARKFLRSITLKENRPGKGGRWSIPATAKDLTTFKKSFARWQKDQADAAAERAAKAAKDAEDAVQDLDADDEEIDEDSDQVDED